MTKADKQMADTAWKLARQRDAAHIYVTALLDSLHSILELEPHSSCAVHYEPLIEEIRQCLDGHMTKEQAVAKAEQFLQAARERRHPTNTPT